MAKAFAERVTEKLSGETPHVLFSQPLATIRNDDRYNLLFTF